MGATCHLPSPTQEVFQNVSSPGKTAGRSIPNSQLITPIACSCVLGKQISGPLGKIKGLPYPSWASMVTCYNSCPTCSPIFTTIYLFFLSFFQIPYPPHKLLLTRQASQAPLVPGENLPPSFKRPSCTYQQLHQD